MLRNLFFDRNGNARPYLTPLDWIGKVVLSSLFKWLLDRFIK